ncbi:MAG: YgfZ/GcvT domain-containing protein [Chthoniobacterales bacterium]
MHSVIRPEEGALFDFSARIKLRISGADRLRYLNGQMTNDLRKATTGLTIRGCILNTKGRINADVFAVVDEDSFLLDAEAEVREALSARLERYVIADDVQIDDVTNEFALFHVLGENPPEDSGCAKVAHAERLGLPGTDLWFRRDDFDIAVQELSARYPLCDQECAETFRIEQGIPRWGRELSEEIIPTEANLEASAIDYAKGCYIGQEVISRIKMSGQTNKRLCGLVVLDAQSLAAGFRLTSAAQEKDVGWITSVAGSTRLGKQIALGFVKRGFQELATRLEARPAEDSSAPPVSVEIVPLPFQ